MAPNLPAASVNIHSIPFSCHSTLRAVSVFLLQPHAADVMLFLFLLTINFHFIVFRIFFFLIFSAHTTLSYSHPIACVWQNKVKIYVGKHNKNHQRCPHWLLIWRWSCCAVVRYRRHWWILMRTIFSFHPLKFNTLIIANFTRPFFLKTAQAFLLRFYMEMRSFWVEQQNKITVILDEKMCAGISHNFLEFQTNKMSRTCLSFVSLLLFFVQYL